GLSSKMWPPLARPSALIPLALQRELNMPHCGPEREYQFARRLLHTYLVNADTILLSHAQQENQQALDPSALIVDVNEILLAQVLPGESDALSELVAIELETIDTKKAPSLQDGEVLRGGVAIYANQAACPFRAFATHRLQAARLETPCTGLSAMQRGILVHHCLDYVWRNLSSQAALQQKTAHQVQEIVAAAIRDALTAIGKNSQPGSMQSLLELERARLQALLTMWLEREAQRPPFTVKHCEYELEVDIAGRPKRLRIDRIDELEDGTHLLIDYKTGVVTAVGWQGEPIQDPQLPLYTLHLNSSQEQTVSGIALARVDSHEPKWVGVGSGANAGFPQSSGGRRARTDETSWDDYVNLWHAGISALDFAFSEGEAEVKPLHGTASCSYCDLKALCRIPKRQLGNSAEGVVDRDS
ncbi:MAG: PD-(D/E)XK nuclease family protein, partial [Pseudomonadales bacterium]